jgi:hypothetical protein
MINARITFEDHFDLLDEQIEARVLLGLNEGAAVMAEVANSRSQGIKTTFHPMPARRTLSGWASAVSASNPIWRVFDKGSLGNRHVRLKRDRRKDSWPVSRKGTTYTAHRRSTETGGVAARNISNPAKLAGLKALLAALGR